MSAQATLPLIEPWHLPSPDALSACEPYRDAIRQLYAFSERPRTAAELRLARERKIDRMRLLLGLLACPQAHFATILVAGTKGKGSTAALLTSILEAAGYRVGRYTQPHLYSYRERTWACGRFITQDEIVDGTLEMADALAIVDSHRSEVGHLTTFDVGTALSLLHFSRVGVEVAVVEVGVGGANDATNALDPILALIGPVGLDHTDVLGEDVAAVAREKAGVLRGGLPGVVAPQEPEAEAAILEAAQAVGARLYRVSRDAVDSTSAACSGLFAVGGPGGIAGDLTIPLRGRFQRDNAAMAVVAAQVLDTSGFQVSQEAIRRGLATVQWPGRFQTVVRDPETVVDGAHNPYAARALASTIRDCMPGRPITLIIGMSRDKDARSFMAELAPLAQRVIVTTARHPRSWEAAELAAIAHAEGHAALAAPTPSEALARAWATQPAHGATIVTGSLFLVGDVMEWLIGEWGATRNDA